MFFGVWRSLVAHLVWDQGAAGSNPVTPTTSRRAFMACRVFFAENTASPYRLPLLFPKKPIGFSGALCSFFKERLRLLPCFSSFPKSLTTFWEPYAFGDFFTKVTVRSFCCGSSFAKNLTIFRELRLRRFFKPIGSLRFVYTKHGFTLSAAAPLSQKTYRFFGSPTFFFSKNVYACSLASPLSQKVFRLFGSTTLRCVLYTNIQLYRKRLRCRGRIPIRPDP